MQKYTRIALSLFVVFAVVAGFFGSIVLHGILILHGIPENMEPNIRGALDPLPCIVFIISSLGAVTLPIGSLMLGIAGHINKSKA